MGDKQTSAGEIADQVTSLVSLPDNYLRVKAVVDAPNSSLEDVAQVISSDAALVARLLEIANSAFFGFPSRVATISRAVTLLGTQQIHDLVLATSIADAFSGSVEDMAEMGEFWCSSTCCGILARLLAVRCNVLDNERLFVEGLLHNIGHLALLRVLPEAIRSTQQKARQTGLPLYRCEQDIIGCDYAEVGAELMQRWNFPPALIASVRYQNDPLGALEFQLEVAIIHLAVNLKTVDISNPESLQGLERVEPLAWQLTGLSAEEMKPLLGTAAEELKVTINALFPQFARSA